MTEVSMLDPIVLSESFESTDPQTLAYLEIMRNIGCAPCTRPVLPNQHEREGRWWWEDTRNKECGLHNNRGQA